MKDKLEFSQELEARKKALEQQLGFITRPDDEKKRHYRCNGYYREIVRNYKRENFPFLPDEFVIDRHGVLSICVGIANAPCLVEGIVLWFFSEGDKEIHYISEHTPENLKRNYEALAS